MSTPESAARQVTHALDTSLQFERIGIGHLRGEPPLAYWNMVGPYGGISAAIVLNAVLRDERCLGDPLVLTINFCAPVRDTPYDVRVSPVRTNRSTQHWSVQMQQHHHGEAITVVQAQVVTGVRRDVWSLPASNPPVLPEVESLRRRAPRDGVRWFDHYDIRLAANPMKAADPSAPVLSWMRDNPPRPLDFPALAALADTFFPGIFAHRKSVVPIATVSMNVYFHVDGNTLTSIGEDWLAGRTGSNVYESGFFDCESQLWHRNALIATTQQIMWYRD